MASGSTRSARAISPSRKPFIFARDNSGAMAEGDVPEFTSISPTQRVDLLISDWRAEMLPEWSPEEKIRRIYGQAWEAYQHGDYGFGLWCWHECDRLTLALQGNIREATRVLGAGRYFGFSHRKAVAEKVPFDRIYRPRKGDMSRPRPDALVLPHYQVLCVHALRAAGGDPAAKAQYEIALGELEELRRADPYLRFFDTFRDLLARTANVVAAPAASPPAGPPPKPSPRPKRTRASSKK